ncbi:MAG: Cys-tRNA(Pro) deacylase [Chloroflexi bacterium HGW-Chloroflexi-6]|nr:MAG: Cys-tRNA(Pro) deacylase [Chloroflexi bacterium HGW-Chloroflexi-6]
MATNNITRYLDAHKIEYTAFETPAEKLGAEATAAFLGVPLEVIFKTIVVKRERGKPILAVISGADEVDLKALAASLGEKKVHLPTEKEAEALTGLQAGGISPLALLNKGFQVVIDASAQNHPEIHISGGQRGLNIRLAPGDLAHLSGARFAHIGRNNSPRP